MPKVLFLIKKLTMHLSKHKHKTVVFLLLTLSTSMTTTTFAAQNFLTHNGWQQSLTRGMQSILLGTCIVCTALLGCERGELRPFAEVLHDRGDAAIIPTQELLVLVDDKDYQGVIGKDGNGRIIAQTVVGSSAFVFMQEMEGDIGFSLDRHQYIGERVYLDGVRDLHVVQRSGIIKEIFDNGYYLLAIDGERYVVDGSPIALLVPYDIIAHEFVLENEDGTSFAGNAYSD